MIKQEYWDELYQNDAGIHPNIQINIIQVIAKQVRNLDSKQGRNPAKQDFKDKSKKWIMLAHFNKPRLID